MVLFTTGMQYPEKTVIMNQCFQFLFYLWMSLFLSSSIGLNAQTNPKYYYVATNGNDSGPGTESLPWKTFAKVAPLATAGVTVFIREGTYNERLVIVNSGTAEEPLTFASYPGETATITGEGMTPPTQWYEAGLIWINGLSNIMISGLRVINSPSTGIDVSGSSYISIEKNYIDNTYNSGISTYICNNIVVDANEILHAATMFDNECISFGVTDNFEIKNNHIHDAVSCGIDVKVGSSNGIICKNEVHKLTTGIYTDAWNSHEYNIDIFDNIAYNNGIGIVVGTENNGLIERIRIHNNKSYDNSERGLWIAGAGVGVTHPIRNIKVYANEFYHNKFGIEIGGLTGTTIDSIGVFNNLIHNNICAGIRITRYDGPSGDYLLRNIAICNNTINGNGTAGNGWDAENGAMNFFNIFPGNILIQNNILSNNAVGTIHVSPDMPTDSLTIDYNFFNGFLNLYDEKTGTNVLYGNPLFVDNLSNDYHLQSASPAIDNGDPDQIYNDPEDHNKPGHALYPAQGILRNDMGAYGGPLASSWDLKSSFTTPAAPVLVLPSNNAKDLPNTLLVTWNAPWGTTSTRLQVSTISDFSSLVTDTIIKGQSCGIRGLENNTFYYWRANATNAGGTSPWSELWSFTTSYLKGIKDQVSSETIRAYPVPVEDMLKIEGIDNESTTVSILSQDGKLLKQIKGRGIQQIDVSELQKGIYLVQISNSQTTITKKIVK